MAASIRMSKLLASAMRAVRSTTASRANVLAAMVPSFWAMASCLPTGAPHWTRSAAHCRHDRRAPFAPTAQNAGMDSRPVFRVMRASLSPRPSPQSRLSLGTLTLWKRITPLDRPLSPRNVQTCPTSTPSHAVSTINALIGFRPRTPSRAGVRTMTTMMSARGPLVHQSFSPFRIQCWPSSESSAVVDRFAGSEPTSCSVRAKADSSPAASRGRYFLFCSSVPK